MESEKLWKDMSPDEKREFEQIYRLHGVYFTDITRKTSDLLFSWCFYLNAGGLAASLTVLSIHESYKFLTIALLIVFFIGIALIMTSCKLENKRFSTKGSQLDKGVERVIKNEVSPSQFFDNIDHSGAPAWLIDTLQYLSLIVFLGALVCGVVFLVYK